MSDEISLDDIDMGYDFDEVITSSKTSMEGLSFNITYKELLTELADIGIVEGEYGKMVLSEGYDYPKDLEGRRIFLDQESYYIVMYVLAKKFVYFNQVIITDIPEDNFISEFKINLFKFGIVLDGFSYNEFTDGVKDNLGFMVIDILALGEDLPKYFRRVEKERGIVNFTEPNFVYIRSIDNYQRYKVIEREISQVYGNMTVLFFDKEGADKFKEEQRREDILKYVPAEETYLINEDNEWIKIFKSVSLEGRYKTMKDFVEFLKDKEKNIVVDCNIVVPRSLYACLVYVYKMWDKKIIITGKGSDVYLEILSIFETQPFNLVQNRAKASTKRGFKIYKFEEGVYVYNILNTVYNSTFKGFEYKDLDKLLSSKDLSSEIVDKLDVRYSDKIPVFVDLFTSLDLDKIDGENSVEVYERIHKILGLCERILLGKDTRRVLTLRDLAIIDVGGVRYIGVFNLKYKFQGHLILETGKPILAGHEVENQYVGYIYDLKNLTDLEINKDELFNLIIGAYGEDKIDREKIMEMTHDSKIKEDLDLCLYFCSGSKDMNISNPIGLTSYEAGISNVLNYNIDNNLLHNIFKYINIGGIRESNYITSPINIYGGLKFNMSGYIPISTDYFIKDMIDERK